MTAVKWILSIFLCFSFLFLTIFGINCVYGYLFPIKFQDEVMTASQQTDVAPEIIFSVINIESHFDKNAVSPKGAVGLMQVLPSTASEIMKTDFQENNLQDLKSPATNIMAGAKYLAMLQKRFENLDTALCAYNAGPNTVKLWLENKDYSSDAKTLSYIPYEETRNYIEKFHKNLKYYSAKIK